MALPEQLIASAIVGTDRKSFEPDALMVSIANAGLTEKAGYVPGHSYLPLRSRAEPEVTVPCGRNAMRYLRLILRDDRRLMLHEWLVAMVGAKQHVRAEILPELLRIGHRHSGFRPYLLHVMGRRGQWLASETGSHSHRWLLNMSAGDDIEALIAGERGQEAGVIRALDSRSANARRRGMEALMGCPFVWSPALTYKFLNVITLIDVHFVRGLYSYRSESPVYVNAMIARAAYQFPLEMRREIIDEIYEMRVLLPEFTHRLVKRVKSVMDFRRSMLDAIANRED